MLQGFAPHGGGFEGQHDAEFRQQAADAVEGGGALLGKALGGQVKADPPTTGGLLSALAGIPCKARYPEKVFWPLPLAGTAPAAIVLEVSRGCSQTGPGRAAPHVKPRLQAGLTQRATGRAGGPADLAGGGVNPK